ncbi:MAG: hypothetical protein KBA06_04810, partial [Saprospiraceae bacterium]|nr:hypothetical protein [Saprospiraceae bacterium]
MLLIKQVRIIDPNSPFNHSVQDIEIIDGRIARIDSFIKPTPKHTIIHFEDASVAPSWLDVGCQINEPGNEHKATLVNTSICAAKGGYSHLITLPNTHPTIQDKSSVFSLKHNTSSLPVTFLPLGAITEQTEGQGMAELYDMYSAGAIGFSDGVNSIQKAGIMLRALQYVKAFDGIIVNQPHDKSLASHGFMHEGAMSTSLGLPGIPSMTEFIMLQRDIHLLEYTQSKLHVLNISTSEAVDQIASAKEKGLKITASVPILNLIFTDEVLQSYDADFKVFPPLRSSSDREHLIDGLKNKTIDCISSNDSPQDEESKNVEFPYASFGALTLEHTFALMNTFLRDKFSLLEIVDILAIRPREVFNQTVPQINIGCEAQLTLFDENKQFKVNSDQLLSIAKNSPCKDMLLKGWVYGIINGQKS